MAPFEIDEDRYLALQYLLQETNKDVKELLENDRDKEARLRGLERSVALVFGGLTVAAVVAPFVL